MDEIWTKNGQYNDIVPALIDHGNFTLQLEYITTFLFALLNLIFLLSLQPLIL